MRLLENKLPQTIGLIGHTIIDYPSHHDALEIIDILVKNNVDLIELQIPFSEPVADGPLFAKANHEAILNGVTVAQCYDFMSNVSSKYPIPFVFMTYANIVFKQGFTQFIKNAKEAGARGAIVPDLPLDIASDYIAVCREQQFAAIPVVAPNISEERLKVISQFFDGFVYAVARAGVTGSKTELDAATLSYLQRLKNYSNLPIAVGFGISCAKDLDYLRSHADYAVVGTQTLRSYQENGLEGVDKLWQELNNAKT